MAADPEALYKEVLTEEQQKGVTPAVAEGRAKAARARAEQGSPHPKEPKWWPGAQPHLEGDGAAPAEAAGGDESAAEAEPETAAETAVSEAAPAAEQPAAPSPPDLGQEEARPEPDVAPQPAAATAAQPAPAATATATEAPPVERPSGVTHGTPTGNRLRPEDAVTTDVQLDAQQAVYIRRKLIDEVVASGVPAVTATQAARSRTSPLILLGYLVIFAVAVAILAGSRDSLGGGEDGGTGAPPEQPAGESIAASDLQFDTDTLTFTAGEESSLEFTNEDASSIQHNVALYSEEGGEEVFKGDVIPGGQTTTYSIPALEKKEATYFQCDIHPGMNGTVTVE